MVLGSLECRSKGLLRDFCKNKYCSTSSQWLLQKKQIGQLHSYLQHLPKCSFGIRNAILAGQFQSYPDFKPICTFEEAKVLTAKSPLQATLGNWWLMILSIIIIIMQAFASALLALLHNDERGEVEKAMAEIKGSGSSDTCTSMYRTWFGKCLLRLSLFCWICFSRLEGGWEMAFCCCYRLQTPNWSFTL